MNRQLKVALLALVGAIVAVATAACGALHPQDYPTDGPSRTATANPQPVTASDFGHAWHLAVDHGTVGCQRNTAGDPVLTFTAPDNTVYALNALPDNAQNPDIEDIANGSVGPLRSFAFQVCEVE